MAPGRQVGGGSLQDEDAKNMFDRIGKDVYETVEKDAKIYKDELKGNLTSSTFFVGERVSSLDPCNLESEYTELISGSGGSGGSLASGVAARGHPCGKGKEHRFSKERVAEYDEKKIRDTNKSKGGNNEGECAPYRRLSLCNKNFQKINNIDSDKARHNLLVDVCMAAKYEGDSIKAHLEKYDVLYEGSGHTTCTALARSFADIGDIIRGKDLYRGNTKEKKKRDELENNLKKIFGDIYNDLTSGRNGKKWAEAKKHYENDTANYYQLREDWWTANRETVWKAITCDADGSYFHATCSERNGGCSQANNKCRCKDENGKNTDQVPTYFDYVPQYLRWFEEWAEDFCRKKKKKLQDAIEKCRGKDKSGNERYCDLNGFDCEKTKRGRNIYRWDYKCTGCFRSCSHFRTWIDNQKEQFLKQKEKYGTEIRKYENGASGSSGSRKRRAATTTNYDGYESKFYKIFKGKCGTVDGFLGLLSKETACEKQPQDGEKISSINFTNANTDDIFSPTEYCQACPLCGVEKKSNGGGNTKWKRKEYLTDCPPIKLYKPTSGAKGTPINFLYSGDETNEIAEKLKKFCRTENGSDGSGAGGRGDSGTSGSKELYQYWTCYQPGELTKDPNPEGVEDEDYNNGVQNGGGLCILPNPKKNERSETNSQNNHADIQKTFNPFFYYWVVHMLKDSIHWRTEKLDKCINNSNETKACKNNNKCNKECGCFEKWVGKKQQEWMAIKEHFGNQEVFKNEGENGGSEMLGNGLTPDFVLQEVLKKDLLLESLQEAYGKPEDIEHIKDLLEKENEINQAEAVAGGASSGKDNTTIDKLLQHEKKEAEQCLEKRKDKCDEPQQSGGGGGPGRSLPPAGGGGHDNADEEQEESEDEDEDHGPDDEVEEEETEPAEDPDGESEALPDETEVVQETVAEVTEEVPSPPVTPGEGGDGSDPEGSSAEDSAEPKSAEKEHEPKQDNTEVD
ncbi:hypothetical protein PFMALIP_03954, partial [Plasmodium falciparum MaliPS096_E11]